MHNYSVSLSTKRLKNPPLLINTHITLPDRNMEAGSGYQGCLPSCELQIHSRHSVSGGLANWKFVDCACKLRNLQIEHVWFTQSQDWLRNLRILKMRNAISRLRKFSDCAEHIYTVCTYHRLE